MTRAFMGPSPFNLPHQWWPESEMVGNENGGSDCGAGGGGVRQGWIT